jgi:hypothetical protein
MTQPNTDPVEHPEPVFGIDESVLEEQIDTIVTDVADLSEGALSDIDVTIVGFKSQKGGETKESKKTPGEFFTTVDQLEVHMRVDNAAELGLENEYTTDYFGVPKIITGKDGKPRRAKPTKSSKYGIWLAALAAAGVSSNPEMATAFLMGPITSILGLRFHRMTERYEAFNGQTFTVNVPTEVYGFDNEIRKNANVPAAYLVGQEPVAASKK